MKIGNHTGARFGRLVVQSKYENGKWLCLCDCGNHKFVQTNHLIGGAVKSCGCFRREIASKMFRKHGKVGSPEYKSWSSMKRRCLKADNWNYKYYGGKGVKICHRWMDFRNFLADMGNRPSAAHTLDRINRNGHYEPSNCKWSTREEQNNNSSQNILVPHNGEKLTIGQLARAYNKSYHLVYQRLGRGWSPEMAVS